MAYESGPVVLGTGDTDIFICPADQNAAVKLSIANIHATLTRQLTLKFYKASTATTTTIAFQVNIAALSFPSLFSMPITMKAGDKLIGSSSAASSLVVSPAISLTRSSVQKGLNPRGAYSAVTTYAENDIASVDDEASYISMVDDNIGNTPNSSPSFWQVLAQQGEQGSAGVAGASAHAVARVVATGSESYATDFENGDTVDGVVLATNDLVLRASTVTPERNGLYVVQTSGAASRHSDFAAFDDHPGAVFSVMEGDNYEDTLWYCSSNKGGTLNTTAILINLQGKADTEAAPEGVFAHIGLQINGDVVISQELGASGASLATGVFKHTADNWGAQYVHGAATAVLTSTQTPGPALGFPAGHTHAHRISATTAITSPANGDYAKHVTFVPGYRMSKLGWGAAGALPLSYAFLLYATAAGVAFVRFTNAAANRAYHRELSVSAGVNFFSGFIPGDVTGTWEVGENVGVRLDVFTSGKAASPAAPDAWSATAATQTTNSTNLLGTNNNISVVTGLVLIPGIHKITQDQLGLYRKHWDTTLWECRQFWQSTYDYGTAPGAVTAAGRVALRATATAVGIVGFGFRLHPPMLKVPTVTFYSPATGTAARSRDDTAAADLTHSSTVGTSRNASGDPVFTTNATATNAYSTHIVCNGQYTS